MAGRGPQSFKKRQKEQQRKEKQQEKLAKRMERRKGLGTPETDEAPEETQSHDDRPISSSEASPDKSI